MKKPKKLNLIPLIVSLILIGVVIYFVKPNKLITYTRAKVGVKNQVLMYELDKSAENYNQTKDDLSLFLTNRGISGTAYEDKNTEYYVSIVPTSTTPETEMAFGFVAVSPEEFYKKVYGTRQVYFTRTLKVID
jgi:hypothetical protein